MKCTCVALFLVLSTGSMLAQSADDPSARVTVSVVAQPDETPLSRPRTLVGLYAASVGLQAYDTYSTLAGVNLQQPERNPFVSGLVNRPALFITAKSVMTLATIAAADGMWRAHHPGRAIALMVVSNSLMAVVDARNASTLRRSQ